VSAASAAGALTAPASLLAFWRAAGPDRWFKKETAFDTEIASRFGAVLDAAAKGELAHWADTPEGALALTIVLDQFPRNMFRGDARTYAADAMARAVATHAIARGHDRQVPERERQFFYLPFMHSENLADQERCLALAKDYGSAEFTKYAEQHADIIRRFGRFPHRNAALGRVTTADEQAFLDGGGFTG
jgi:uncharacterized protein (DUF924 family)